MTKTLDAALKKLDSLTNLYDFLATGFPKNAHSLAIETPDGRFYTFRDLERASARMARPVREYCMKRMNPTMAKIASTPIRMRS